MKTTPVKSLSDFGQSPWLDYIQRDLIASGKLANLRNRWGLRGVTTNPSIFEQAVSQTESYDDQILQLARKGLSTAEICERLMIDDVCNAADVFRGIYDQTQGADGFVSLEVSPHLAHDVDGTIDEANRLWAIVNRRNLMIKVPGTKAGLQAIRKLLAVGINVNVTLLFSLERYKEVTEAFLCGLEEAAASGRDIRTISSVASFFVSRIDTLIDPRLEALFDRPNSTGEIARKLHGEIAIACARSAYEILELTLTSKRFQDLTGDGAWPQRLLWASTSTKDPAYSDIKYVEPLIGPHTVNTMTLGTLEAYDDHGKPAARIHDDRERAAEYLAGLRDIGLDIGELAQKLENEGVQKFRDAFEALHRTIETKSVKLSKTALS